MGKERLVLSSWEAALTRFVESSGMIFSPFLACASPEKQFQDFPNGGVPRGIPLLGAWGNPQPPFHPRLPWQARGGHRG